MKLFNGKEYLILSIKQDEKKELLDIIKKHNLEIMYPSVFEEDSNLVQFTINDKQFGGHLASFICHYEYDIIKNSKREILKDVQGLKEYIKKADERKEPLFLIDGNHQKYFNYVDSLSNHNLKDEYYIVATIISIINSNYLAVKDTIDNLSKSIKNNLVGAQTKEDINNYLERIRQLRIDLDQVLDFDIYLVNKNNSNKNLKVGFESDNSSIAHMRMRSFLKKMYQYCHQSNESRLSILKSIRKNLIIIFHLFNYKLNAEGIVSYKHYEYDCIRELGYSEICPDYLVGKKIGKEWDYQSVAERLRYTLKIFDCYPLLSNKFIPVKYCSREEIESFAEKMVELGFKDPDDLCNVSKKEYPPVSIFINTKEKAITHGPGITVMACICSSRKREVLSTKEILNNVDKIINNYDFVFYNLLLLEITNKHQGPKSGIYSIKEAEKINGDSKLKKLISIIKNQIRQTK